jgi:TrmH family RNA methyltransferase
MNEISSGQNPKYKRWLSLTESKGIKKENLALVSGEKLVREYLREQPSNVEDILLPPKSKEEFPSNFRQTRLSSPLFKALDVLGTHSSLLVVRLTEIPVWQNEPPRGLELIVALGDPSNLGALLRSAEAFGVSRVVLTKECASPFLPKALKAASNAAFRVPLFSANGSLSDLKIENAVGLDMAGEDLNRFHWPKDCYLVLGEEGQGLPPITFTKIRIPMSGKIESLNATVAASLAMYSYRS